MSDNDFLDEMQKEARLRFGRELTPQEAAERFSLHSFNDRVQHLKRLRSEPGTVREIARRHAFESALHRTHESLRKVGR